jgi:hypothetical protein
MDHMVRYFSQAKDKLQAIGLPYIFDPCFGFSKTRSQNHQLLVNFKNLLNNFHGIDFVYGVSRKSFLRFPKELNVKEQEGLIQVEALQTLLLQQLKDHTDHKVILNLINDSHMGATHEGRRLFTFNTDNVALLHDLRQKLEFYYYREGVPTELFQGHVELKQDGEVMYLDLKDPDGNIWTVQYLPDAITRLKKTDVLETNVSVVRNC